MQNKGMDNWSRNPRFQTLDLIHRLDQNDEFNDLSAAYFGNFSYRIVPAEEWLDAMSRISEELDTRMCLYGRKKVIQYESKVLITAVSETIYGDRDCYRIQVCTEHLGHRSHVVDYEKALDIIDKLAVELYPIPEGRTEYDLFRASHDENFARKQDL